MKVKILKLSFIVLSTIACIFSCAKSESEDGGTIPSISSININPNSLELLLGDSSIISVVHTPSTVSAPSYEWSSADATIATVEKGKVKGLRLGETTITAKIPNSTIKSEVRVKVLPIGPANLNLNLASHNLAIGEKVKMNYEILPANTTGKENLVVEWSSDNSSVATIDNTGEVTAIAIGTATITGKIKDTNITKKIEINVTPVGVQSITLNASSGTLSIGNSVSLTANVLPVNATNKTVTWTSSNNTVATVNAAGIVNAKALGTAIITATSEDGNKTATYTLTVSAINVTGVTLNATSGTLSVGQTRQLTATIAPLNATNKQVTWTSSNTNIATVSSNGIIKAVAAGSATITVKSVDGNKTANFNLTVSPIAVTGVTLNATSGTLNIGRTLQLTANVTPTNAANKQITWSTSNANVATVSSNGLITAVGIGSAIITVKTSDGNKTANYTVTVSGIDVQSLLLTINNDNIEVGQTSQPTVLIQPTNATNRNLTWTSSNTSVATINPSTGLITAVATGTTILTVRSNNGKSVSKEVRVRAMTISALELNVHRLDLLIGDRYKLAATPTPRNASINDLHWESSVPGVATVDQQGNVTAVANGTTTVRVSIAPGSRVYKQIEVSVQNAQTTFKLTQAKGIIQLVGNRIDLNCTISLSNPTSESITYAGFVVKDANNNIKSTVSANSTITPGGGIGFSYLLTNFNGTFTMYVKIIYKGTTYEMPIDLKRGA